MAGTCAGKGGCNGFCRYYFSCIFIYCRIIDSLQSAKPASAWRIKTANFSAHYPSFNSTDCNGFFPDEHGKLQQSVPVAPRCLGGFSNGFFFPDMDGLSKRKKQKIPLAANFRNSHSCNNGRGL